jgi:hypothetical protein
MQKRIDLDYMCIFHIYTSMKILQGSRKFTTMVRSHFVSTYFLGSSVHAGMPRQFQN